MLQTLENVTIDASSSSENEILTDVAPQCTDNFEIFGTSECNDSAHNDDSIQDKEFIPTSSFQSSSEEYYHSSESESGTESESGNEGNFHEDQGDEQQMPNNIPRPNEEGPQREEGNALAELKINSRKRVRRSKTWKRNIKKRKVNSGQSYISEGGRQVPEKK